jgi:hypothetical protein
MGGQDAHPTRKSILCGTGILPVADNGARSQFKPSLFLFLKLLISITIASNSTPQYYNLVRSKDALYIDRLGGILIFRDRPSTVGTQAENSFAMLA